MGELRFESLSGPKGHSFEVRRSTKYLSKDDDVLSVSGIKEIKLDFDTLRQRKQSFLPDSMRVSHLDDKQRSWSKTVSFQEDSSGRLSRKYTNNEVVRFITGSKYRGQWNNLGITGKGIYKFPHGVIYDGNFNTNNEFHGDGMLIYPSGAKLEGSWNNGKLISGTISSEEHVYDEQYCQMPDRRFQIERESGLQPAHQENLTKHVSAKVIPDGCYDCGEGFYDPKKRLIINYDERTIVKPIEETDYFIAEERLRNISPSDYDMLKYLEASISETDIVSLPDTSREIWIQMYCRKGWDEAVGHLPELYETWTPGSKKYENEENTKLCLKGSSMESDTSIFTSYFQHLFGLLRDKVQNKRSPSKDSSISYKIGTVKLRGSPNAREINDILMELVQKRYKSSASSGDASNSEEKRLSPTKMTIPKVSI